MSRKKHPLKPLTEKQKQAVAMVYDDERITDIAASLGVHRTTIWRWQQKREFRKEWLRIDRNWRRKLVRREAKIKAQEEAYWSAEEEKWKKKLDEEGQKIVREPGKAWYKAYNEYMRAVLHGRSLSDVLKSFETGEYKPRKRHRR